MLENEAQNTIPPKESFEYLSQEQYDRLKPKLQRLSTIRRDKLILVLDWDLTMAAKDDPDDVDKAPLKRAHYEKLRQWSEEINRTIVSTARGNAPILAYLRDPFFVRKFGLIKRLILASNSGHYVYGEVSCDGPKPQKIKIPGYEDKNPSIDTVIEVIDDFVTKLCDYTVDGKKVIDGSHRECCGAVTFNKFKTVEEFEAFNKYADQLMENLPKDIQKNLPDTLSQKEKEALAQRIADSIYFSKKRQINTDKDGNVINVQGYIDIKPKRMDKGLTTREILTNPIFNVIDGEPQDKPILEEGCFIVVAGDSPSDYPLMQAAVALLGPENVLAIDVSGGITHDPISGKNFDTDGIIDLVLPPTKQYPAVDQLYLVIDDTVNTCVPCPKNAARLIPKAQEHKPAVS